MIIDRDSIDQYIYRENKNFPEWLSRRHCGNFPKVEDEKVPPQARASSAGNAPQGRKRVRREQQCL